ncbi:hypothetical protein QQF64_020526 [Cirrhinus molitorella]|uniref:Uncharacterized protein n=1 Tax=Cirrhinus molitorella TaxID=172907 RepID=A0ABR3LC10_9TELE
MLLQTLSWNSYPAAATDNLPVFYSINRSSTPETLSYISAKFAYLTSNILHSAPCLCLNKILLYSTHLSASFCCVTEDQTNYAEFHGDSRRSLT